MRIMLLGAGGFIGRHIMTELLGSGHEVNAVVRSVGDLAEAFPQVRFVAMDLARAVSPEDWREALSGVDIVINAAGLLRGRDMEAVHVSMPRALYGPAISAPLAGCRFPAPASRRSRRCRGLRVLPPHWPCPMPACASLSVVKRMGCPLFLASGLVMTAVRHRADGGDMTFYGG